MTALAKTELLQLIQGTPPLLTDYPDLEAQLQPNGVDLTLKEVFSIKGQGVIPVSNTGRELSTLTPLTYDDTGRIHLPPGNYLITYNEVVSLPKNVMALGRARSSLLRCGAAIHTAVWDAGYSGRSQSLVVVYNRDGITFERNARLMQLVFFRLSGTTEGYEGIYQNENTIRY
jgi:dUTP pyrophosphatase